MSHYKEAEGANAPGNEWEVVSLTASTYAACPGPKEPELTDDEKATSQTEDEPETSLALFMSRHFVFQPNQHENCPTEISSPNVTEKQGGKDGVAQLDAEVARYSVKDEKELAFDNLTLPDEYSRMQFACGRDNRLPMYGTELKEGKLVRDFGLMDEEQSLYGAASTFSSLHGETTLGAGATFVDNTITSDIAGASEPHLHSPSDALCSSEPIKDEILQGADLPCDAWWRRRAAALYSHAKEANAFWSVFIAAAVMGLAILGHKWHQDRCQALQLRWHVSINSEEE